MPNELISAKVFFKQMADELNALSIKHNIPTVDILNALARRHGSPVTFVEGKEDTEHDKDKMNN